MFKFNFNPDDDELGKTVAVDTELGEPSAVEAKPADVLTHVPTFRAREVLPSELTIAAETIVGELLSFPRPHGGFVNASSSETHFTLARREISDIKFQIAVNDKSVDISNLSHSVESDEASALVRSITDRTDLIPGVYEGGLKTWECSLDLVEFLSRTFDGKEKNSEMQEQTVLEIGCGAALPGIYCVSKGSRRVDLQDYNPTVLSLVTAPNVLLNTSHKPDADSVDPSSGTFEIEVSSDGDHEQANVLEPTVMRRKTEMDSAYPYGGVRFWAGSWSTLPVGTRGSVKNGFCDASGG
ncbi:hypothetical protein HDU93_007610 [Gonapodya sp. JEL0774]|nr:hypothetical protein HDU93_007610 [Gonapodya sp. JEL0774]